MIVSQGIVKNGQLETVESMNINQSGLTADCWSIQFYGLKACKKCESKGKKTCGGKNIIKQLKDKENEQRNNNSN
jgi:hypothetical protein